MALLAQLTMEQEHSKLISSACPHCWHTRWSILGSLVAALRQACNKIERFTTGRAQRTLAVRDFLGSVEAMGANTFHKGSRSLEDTCLRLNPDTCLEEGVLRAAWLAFSDELSRTGHEPEYTGVGRLEGWVASAVSRAYPYAEPGGQGALSVLPVKGPVVFFGVMVASVLADARRQLLSRRPDVYVPAITSCAQESMAHLLRIGEQTPSLSETLSEAVKRVEYGEDFIGILGRVGRSQPVALFLTEAHLYSRSCLLGLPLFLEPDTERDALLVLSSRDGAVTGPLQETLDEAERRGVLTILDVPALTSEEVRKVVQGTPGLKIDESQLLEAEEQHLSVDSVRTLFLKHLADQADESVHQSSEELKAEFSRLTEPVRSLLALAALEGIEFHLAAVASVLDTIRKQRRTFFWMKSSN